MKNQITILSILLLLGVVDRPVAQPSMATLDAPYGLDPLLYNGRYYTFFFSSGTKGSPFFNGREAILGSVTLKGQRYDNLQLKYDIFNQFLTLLFEDKEGGVRHIIVSDTWLESFDLEDVHFEVITNEENAKQIYQVIGSGNLEILYYWYKTQALDSRTGNRNYVFSSPNRRSFTKVGNSIIKFSSNKSFLENLPPDIQDTAKKYLLQHKLKVMKATDQQMIRFIDFYKDATAR